MFTNAAKLYGCTWESYPSGETVTRIMQLFTSLTVNIHVLYMPLISVEKLLVLSVLSLNNLNDRIVVPIKKHFLNSIGLLHNSYTSSWIETWIMMIDSLDDSDVSPLTVKVLCESLML